MTVTPANILKIAWSMPPRDFFARARLKLKGGAIRVRDRFDADPDGRNWQRHFVLLSRMETAARQRFEGWEPFEPEGKRLFELGCGMVGGVGALAIFRGAAKAFGIEPNWDPSVLDDPYFEAAYFRRLWDYLVGIYGERMAFEAFMERLRADLMVSNDADAWDTVPDDVDCVLSVSCLEHVADPASVIGRLARLGTAKTRHIHLVDFCNHWSRNQPFEGLYDTERERAVAANAPGINSARLPDILDLFERSGLTVRHAVLEREPMDRARIHPSWLERYSPEDLTVRLAAVFVG